MLKRFSYFILFLFIFILSSPAYAVTTPTFPVCSNPQGSVKVSYDSGTHGVPGLSQSFTGNDAVYTTTDDTLMQCLCVDNGEGIQTNWWKASSLTSAEIETLKSQGWFYIPSGANWGLSSEPFMAINSAYSCGNGLGGIGGGEVLAGTGDSLKLYAVGALGIVFILLGLRNKRRV